MSQNGEEPATAAASADAPTENNQVPPPAEMRTITLTGYGGVRMVKVLPKPEVKPKEGEVLIRVKAWWVVAAPIYILKVLIQT